MMRMDKGLWYWILRVMFALILLLNVATVLSAVSIYSSGTTEDNTPTLTDDVGGTQDAGELDEDLGGVTQVTGILTYLVIVAMLIISIGLLRNHEGGILGAGLIIAFDGLAKIFNVVAELISGTAITDLWLAFVVIVVEAVVAYGFFIAYRDRRHAMGESADIRDAASHGHGEKREPLHTHS